MKESSSSDNNKQEERKGISLSFVAFILALGIVILVLYSLSLGADSFLTTLSIASMIAFTSSIVGAFVGFIFGIPRTPASKDPDNIAANTNLEEISDWITKIIVGVSLVQLNQLSGGIVELGNTLSAGLGNHPTSFVFSVSTLIFYFVGGFFLGYLWSRIYLPKILRTSLEEGYLKKIKEQENQIIKAETLLEETKSLQDEQMEVRKKVDEIISQSEPKNKKFFNSENFTINNLEKLVDNIIKHFDKKESSNLFGQIINSLYKVGYDHEINQLTDKYKNQIDINYPNWTDVALANLSLYSANRSPEFKERMKEAVNKSREKIADYGVIYAIELYYNLIDLDQAIKSNDKQLEENAKANISFILNEIKLKQDLTSFEVTDYLNRNEGKPVWTEYNKMLREMFPADYNEIFARSENYKNAHPDIAKLYEN